jgi:hypothetical protein
MLHIFQGLWSSWDWGTRFALVAVVVSLATLIGVLAQIVLARNEVGLVKADLLQNKRMIDEALKHPKLVLLFDNSADLGNAMVPTVNVEAYEVPTASLVVTNSGERTAHNVRTELYIPKALLPNYKGAEKQIDGINHVIFQGIAGDDQIHPLRAPVRAFANASYPRLERFSERQRLRWRLFDDYGIYPEGYGELFLDPPVGAEGVG